MKTALIIGAGPAGLTAATELLRRTDIHPIVLESTRQIGGISQTVQYHGNRMDIGGHRFFSKNDIALIRTIHYLTKVKGYTIQGARDALKNNFIQEADNATIIASLTEIKEMLLKIKKELD